MDIVNIKPLNFNSKFKINFMRDISIQHFEENKNSQKHNIYAHLIPIQLFATVENWIL